MQRIPDNVREGILTCNLKGFPVKSTIVLHTYK